MKLQLPAPAGGHLLNKGRWPQARSGAKPSFASSSVESPSSPKRARFSWMEEDLGEHCSGGASSGGASQDGISVLYELCMGSQVYGAIALVLHDDMGGGSLHMALIGDGFSVESPSPTYMEIPASPSAG